MLLNSFWEIPHVKRMYFVPPFKKNMIVIYKQFASMSITKVICNPLVSHHTPQGGEPHFLNSADIIGLSSHFMFKIPVKLMLLSFKNTVLSSHCSLFNASFHMITNI